MLYGMLKAFKNDEHLRIFAMKPVQSQLKLAYGKHYAGTINRSEFSTVNLDFPSQWEKLPNPFAPRFGCKDFFPEEAFTDDGKLIVLNEARWAASLEYGGNPLPGFWRDSLTTEEFTHELLAFSDYTVKGITNFMNEHGIIVAPFFHSWERFLNSRYHASNLCIQSTKSSSYDSLINEAQNYFSIYNIHLPECYEKCIKRQKRNDRKSLSSLAEALWSVSSEKMREARGLPYSYSNILSDAENESCSAIILSEYARRILCANKKDYKQGGIVAYYEVLLTIKALQKSIRYVMEFEISIDKDLESFEAFLIKSEPTEAGKKVLKQTLQERAFWDNINIDADIEIGHREALHNRCQHDLQLCCEFISACIFSTPTGKALFTKRREADPQRLYGKNAKYSNRDHFKSRDEHGTLHEEKFSDILAKEHFRRYDPQLLDNVYMESSYTSAICVQFVNTLNDPHNWKKCRNQNCDNYFKLTSNVNSQGQRDRQGIYCCKKCGSDARNLRNNAERKAIGRAIKGLRNQDPGYTCLSEAVQRVEETMDHYFKNSIGDLPKARKRWERKLNLQKAQTNKLKND